MIVDGRPTSPYQDHNDSLMNGEAHTGSSIHSSEDRNERDNGKLKKRIKCLIKIMKK